MTTREKHRLFWKCAIAAVVILAISYLNVKSLYDWGYRDGQQNVTRQVCELLNRFEERKREREIAFWRDVNNRYYTDGTTIWNVTAYQDSIAADSAKMIIQPLNSLTESESNYAGSRGRFTNDRK